MGPYGEAAVHHEVGAGNEGAGGCGKEERGMGHVRGNAATAEGMQRGRERAKSLRIRRLTRVLFPKTGIYVARADGVHPDVVVR
jgi:hypothetical protein